ncbi:hypothetical protein CCMA1212_009483 [Trichoderma ghanense]|uniref:F-box domain-containing protein n=1 Tax=Trichoderma ghanense TaxID=65468 RepID=A0ABY2GRP7_9HYPO
MGQVNLTALTAPCSPITHQRTLHIGFFEILCTKAPLSRNLCGKLAKSAAFNSPRALDASPKLSVLDNFPPPPIMSPSRAKSADVGSLAMSAMVTAALPTRGPQGFADKGEAHENEGEELEVVLALFLPHNELANVLDVLHAVDGLGLGCSTGM